MASIPRTNYLTQTTRIKIGIVIEMIVFVVGGLIITMMLIACCAYQRRQNRRREWLGPTASYHLAQKMGYPTSLPLVPANEYPSAIGQYPSLVELGNVDASDSSAPLIYAHASNPSQTHFRASSKDITVALERNQPLPRDVTVTVERPLPSQGEAADEVESSHLPGDVTAPSERDQIPSPREVYPPRYRATLLSIPPEFGQDGNPSSSMNAVNQESTSGSNGFTERENENPFIGSNEKARYRGYEKGR